MEPLTRSAGVALIMVLCAVAPFPALAQDGGFTPVPPCRIISTLSGSRLNAETDRFFRVRGTAPDDNVAFAAQGGSPCGIPDEAIAVVFNYIVASPTGPGHIVAEPSDAPSLGTNVLNYTPAPGQLLNLANGIITPLCNLATCPPNGDIRVRAVVSSTHFLVDVSGYFTASTFITRSVHIRGASGSVCAANPCVVSREYPAGWIQQNGAIRVSPGQYQIFLQPVFSGVPNCTVAGDASPVSPNPDIGVVSASSTRIDVTVSLPGLFLDGRFSVICHGPSGTN